MYSQSVEKEVPERHTARPAPGMDSVKEESPLIRSEVSFQVPSAGDVFRPRGFAQTRSTVFKQRASSVEPSAMENGLAQSATLPRGFKVNRKTSQSESFVEKEDDRSMPQTPSTAGTSRQTSCDSTTSEVSTSSTLSMPRGPAPLKTSPREYIIPIALEGGGLVSPPISQANSARQTPEPPEWARMKGFLSHSNSNADEPLGPNRPRLNNLQRLSSFGKQPRSMLSTPADQSPQPNQFTQPQGYRLRATMRAPSMVDRSDSFSSAGEDDDDDNDDFEILTAESLFDTLLARVCRLTRRLNKDDPFPSRRLSSRLSALHSTPFSQTNPRWKTTTSSSGNGTPTSASSRTPSVGDQSAESPMSSPWATPRKAGSQWKEDDDPWKMMGGSPWSPMSRWDLFPRQSPQPQGIAHHGGSLRHHTSASNTPRDNQHPNGSHSQTNVLHRRGQSLDASDQTPFANSFRIQSTISQQGGGHPYVTRHSSTFDHMTPSSPLENGKPEGMKLSGHSGGRKYGRSVTVLGTPGGPQVNFTTTQSDSGVPLHQSGSADEESKRRKAREEIISRLTKRASILGDDDRRFARSSLIRPRSTYLLSSMGSDNDPLPPTSPQPSAAPPGKVTISLRVRREPQSAYGRSLLQTPAGVGGSESGGGPSSISPGRTTDNIRSSMSPTLLNLIRSTEALYNSEAANKEARRGTLVAHEDEDDGPHNTSRGERSGSGTPRNSPGPPSGETEPLVNRMKKEGKLKGGHRLSEEKEVARKPRIGRPPAGTDVPVNDVQRRCPPATSELEESLDNDLNAKIEERKLSDGSRSGSSGPPSRKSSAGSRIPRRLSNDSSADDGPHLPSRSPQISPISNPYAMSALQELENEESVSERIRRKSYYSRFNSEVGLGTPVSSIRRRPSHKLSGSAVGLDGSDGGGLGGLPQRRTSPGFWRDSPTTELLGNDVRSTSVSPLFHSERHSSSRTPEADPRRILRRFTMLLDGLEGPLDDH